MGGANCIQRMAAMRSRRKKEGMNMMKRVRFCIAAVVRSLFTHKHVKWAVVHSITQESFGGYMVTTKVEYRCTWCGKIMDSHEL